MRLRGRGGARAAAALVAVAAAAAAAAPTTERVEPDSATATRERSIPGLQGAGRGGQGADPAAGSGTPTGTSTGNRNLDLLIEMQGRPDAGPPSMGGPPAASPASAAAAAAAMQSLRERLAQDQARRAGGVNPIGDPTRSAERLAAPDAALQAPQHSVSGAAGDATSGVSVRSAGSADPVADGAPRRFDDTFERWLLRETLAFLRENRLWLLGAVAAVAAISAGIKAYSRRP